MFGNALEWCSDEGFGFASDGNDSSCRMLGGWIEWDDRKYDLPLYSGDMLSADSERRDPQIGFRCVAESDK